MERFFNRFANGWLILISLVATGTCIVYFGELIETLGAGILDGRMEYNLAEVKAAFAIYGEEGRAAYARAALTLDTVFPLAYGALFMGLLMRYRLHRLFYLVGYLLLFGILVDYAENIQIANLLWAYPDISVEAVQRTSLATWVKWVSLRTVQAIIALQLIITFVRWCARELGSV